MSDLIVIQPQVTQLTVTEDVNQVVVSSVGVQGLKGDTGATGATGAQGPSGVVSVTAPITNSGTSTSANIGIDLSNIALKYALPWQVKYLTGYWYDAKNGSQITSSAYVLNRLYLYPLFIQESITIDRLGVECTVANASTTWRVGIYNADSNGVPTTVLLDAGTVDTSTTGLKTITVSQTLNAGLYYIAGVWQGGSTSPQMRSYNSAIGNFAPVASTGQQIAGYASNYQINSGVSGALPTFSGSTVASVSVARTQFRIA